MHREKYQNTVYFWKGKGQDFLRRGMRELTVVCNILCFNRRLSYKGLCTCQNLTNAYLRLKQISHQQRKHGKQISL